MLLLNPKNLQPAEEQRLVLYDITWQQYEQFSNLFDNEFVKMIYLEGALALMYKSQKYSVTFYPEVFAQKPSVRLISFGDRLFKELLALALA